MRRTGRAKLALVLLGVASCVGTAAYAVAQTSRSSAPPATNGLSATSPFSRSLSIRVSPASQQAVAPGERAEYMVQVRHRAKRMVTLSVLDGLPAGASASYGQSSFRKRERPKSGTTLTIDTGDAASGGYRIRLLARSGRRRAIASVNLVIRSEQPSNFSISGDLADTLEPGRTVPLDLELTNPGTVALLISGLEVSLASVTAPMASASYPCTTDDFEVVQFSDAYGFTLGASATSTLGQLGFASERWPQVTMLDRPVNQDGCQGATIQFDFTGTAGAAS